MCYHKKIYEHMGIKYIPDFSTKTVNMLLTRAINENHMMKSHEHDIDSDYQQHKEQLKALSKQFGRYAAVGGTAFVIDFVLMVLFTEKGGWNPVISSLVSFIISLFVNYAMSMKWVFHRRDDISRGKEFGIFAALATIGLVMNEAIMAVGVGMMFFDYRLTKLVSTGIVTIYNFISRKKTIDSD